MREQIGLVARVLPFKFNRYVIEQLIDWSNVPDDPLFRLTFSQPDMLPPDDLAQLAALARDASRAPELDALIAQLREPMNPHPADQRLNEPELDGEHCAGIQHKYAQTVLYLPSHGQTCHAYCTFCFRWPQFVGDTSLKFASSEAATLHRYTADRNPRVVPLGQNACAVGGASGSGVRFAPALAYEALAAVGLRIEPDAAVAASAVTCNDAA